MVAKSRVDSRDVAPIITTRSRSEVSVLGNSRVRLKSTKVRIGHIGLHNREGVRILP